jgi:cullin-associated NEDD8-dissociated protein 1
MQITIQLTKHFKGNSIESIRLGFLLLTKIVCVLRGGLGKSIEMLIPTIKSSLSIERSVFLTTNTNLKIEILEFLSVVLQYHDFEVLSIHLSTFVASVVEATFDRFYKVRAVALNVITLIVNNIFQTDDVMTDSVTEIIIKKLYDSSLSLLKQEEKETEVIICSIQTLASIISCSEGILDIALIEEEIIPEIFSYLHQDSTTAKALEAIDMIAKSKAGSKISKGLWLEFVTCSHALLTKANRQVVLQTIPSIISVSTHISLSELILTDIINDLEVIFLHQNDFQILKRAFDLLSALVDNSSTFNIIFNLNNIKTLLDVVKRHYLVLGTGPISISLQNLWKKLLNAHGKVFYEQCIVKIIEPEFFQDICRDGQMIVSKLVGACADSPLAQSLVELLHSRMAETDENMLSLTLYCLGEIGSRIDLGKIIPDIHLIISTYFNHKSAKVQHSAAYCLGHFGVCPNKFYMQYILSKLKSNEYFFIIAMYEMIIIFDIGLDTETINTCWDLLLAIDVSKLEGSSMVSDAIGKLVILQPELLESLINNLQFQERRIVSISSFRYVVLHSDSTLNTILYPNILPILNNLQSDDLEVTKATLDTLQALTLKKPRLIMNMLSDLLPMVYNHLIFNKEHLTVVQMGPFQHKADKGLECRKIAYELFHALLTNAKDVIDLAVFIEKVLVGLSDPSNIIIQKTHSILRTAVENHSWVIQRHLPTITQALQKSIFIQQKDTIVKQDLENNRNLIKSSLEFLKKLEIEIHNSVEVRVLVNQVLKSDESALFKQL